MLSNLTGVLGLRMGEEGESFAKGRFVRITSFTPFMPLEGLWEGNRVMIVAIRAAKPLVHSFPLPPLVSIVVAIAAVVFPVLLLHLKAAVQVQAKQLNMVQSLLAAKELLMLLGGSMHD